MMHRPRISYLPYIRLEDFSKFAEILALDDAFPNGFDAWETLLDARADEIWASHNVPIFTGVDPAGFQHFIDRSTASANIDTLLAYVALVSSVLLDNEQRLSEIEREVARLGSLQ